MRALPMSTSSVRALALAALVSSAGACDDEALSDDAFGVIDLAPFWGDGATTANPLAGMTRTFAPQRGYANGATVEYYDFGFASFSRQASGALVASVNPMYVFFDARGNPMLAEPVLDERQGIWVSTGGNPTFGPNQAAGFDPRTPHSVRPKRGIWDQRRGTFAHQRPIVDVLPGAPTYTGLWEIVEVTAPDGYDPDTIKSWKTLKRALSGGGFRERPTGAVVNCPVLEERQAVTPAFSGYRVPRPLIELWYRTKLGACFLANGWEALAGAGAQAGAELLKARNDAARLNVMDVNVLEVTSGTVERRIVTVPIGRFYQPMSEIKNPEPGRPAIEIRYPGSLVADYRPRHRRDDPPGYTPILSQWDIVVPLEPAYRTGNFKRAADVDDTLRRERRGGPFVRNLVVLDPLPDCGPRAGETCGGEDRCVDAGLSCNPATCQCDAPRAGGYGAYCAPGVARCKTKVELTPEELALAPQGFICHARTPRGVCYPQCNAGDPNLSAGRKGPGGEDLDSRCGNLPGFTCQTPREGTTSDGNANSVCLRACNPRDGTEKVVKACTAPVMMRLPAKTSGDMVETNIAAGLTCQTIRTLTACSFDETLEPR